MKILLVEDDGTTRRILKRLMSSGLGAEVIEASNGMEALLRLEADRPDLIVTDVNMPVLDGIGLMQAVRSSAAHSDIPAVAVSSSSERAMVGRLIELGIADYLLKPLDLTEVSKRLGKVLHEIRSQPKTDRPAPGGSGTRARLLLVEPDPNFRELFVTVIGGRYEVIEATSGPQGLSLAAAHRPDAVCVADGLGLLNEQQLSRHLKELATPPSAIYLLHAADPPANADASYTGLVRKSFVQKILADRWAAVSGDGDLTEMVRRELAGPLQAEVVTATQQTFGVLAQQEVERIPDEELSAIPEEVVPAVPLVAGADGFRVPVALFGTKADAERLASLILGESKPWNEGGNQAFTKLVDTLAGRLRSSFDSRGIKLEQGEVESLDEGGRPPTEWAFRAGFKTAGGERFVVAVGVPHRVAPPKAA